MTTSRAPAVIIAAMLAVATCGVPTDEAAVAIDADQLPEALRPGVTTTTTTTVAAPVTETAIVFLLQAIPDSERRVVREVRRDVARGATLEAVLSTIFGPEVRTEEEQELGYSNALFELSLLGAVVIDSPLNEDGTPMMDAVVDIQPLTPEGLPSEDPFTGDLIGAAAQIVFTATEYDEVTGVQILINGEEVPIPTNDPDTQPGAILDRSNYEFFDPNTKEVIPTTTTTTEPAE